jgi:hypothetical protein
LGIPSPHLPKAAFTIMYTGKLAWKRSGAGRAGGLVVPANVQNRIGEQTSSEMPWPAAIGAIPSFRRDQERYLL